MCDIYSWAKKYICRLCLQLTTGFSITHYRGSRAFIVIRTINNGFHYAMRIPRFGGENTERTARISALGCFLTIQDTEKLIPANCIVDAAYDPDVNLVHRGNLTTAYILHIYKTWEVRSWTSKGFFFLSML